MCRWLEAGLCPWGRDVDNGEARVDSCDDYRPHPVLRECDECGEKREVTKKGKKPNVRKLCRDCLVGPDKTDLQDPIYREQSMIVEFEILADKWSCK